MDGKEKIVGKIESLKKLKNLNKPTKMGEKILLLATAPCVKDFFEFESVREQFQDYDLAFINYMIFYSQKEAFLYKPKYIILLDPIFYQSDYFGKDKVNPEKEKIRGVLKKIDWECYIITSVLADFGVKSDNINYIRLSCFELPYKKWAKPFYKRNICNMGIYNVMQGAIYFSITFGYKEIAILGCTYQPAERCMKEDGLYIYGYAHYYDLERICEYVPIEKLRKMDKSFLANALARGAKSLECFWNLKKYGNEHGAHIINYSEGSAIDAFETGTLKMK